MRTNRNQKTPFTGLLAFFGRARVSLSVGSLSLCVTAAAFAASLDSQWGKLPEIKVKPESGSSSTTPTLRGGNQWRGAIQTPDTVVVKFGGEFFAEGVVSATLAGVTVCNTNDYGTCNDFVATPAGEARLKPYETYLFTLAGENVYLATGKLKAPSLMDLFSGPTIGLQPERFYNLYIWVSGAQRWEKLCDANEPLWNIDACQAMSATFRVQVRPDLGARPVSRPGVAATRGGDQGDDSWTRSEPAIDAKTAPGDAAELQMSSSRQGDPASARFVWEVSLGRLHTGAGAGRIRIDESRLSTNTYSPSVLAYPAPSAEPGELVVLMDLDDTNVLAQVVAPQCVAAIDPLYGSPLLVTNDLLSLIPLVQQITNRADPVCAFLWSNFTATGQQTLTNTNATVLQLQSTIVGELNTVIQSVALYDSGRFMGIALAGRARRLLLLNPSGDALTRLNRFLLEAAFSGKIARLGSTRFQLAFFLPSQVGPVDSLGFYTLAAGATGFATWQFGLPPGATNQWELLEIRNATTNRSLLAYQPGSGVWALTSGDGTEARTETRTISVSASGGMTNAVETVQVRSGGGATSDQTVEVYRQYDWGFELVAVTNDPGGANLVTQFVFNTDPGAPATYEKLNSILYPDGFWEKRVYSTYTEADWQSQFAPNGSLIRIIQPWKDSPTNADPHDCLVTDYAYNQLTPGGYRMQKWHGVDGSWVLPGTEDTYDTDLGRSVCAVYAEDTSLYAQPCAETQGLVTECRQLGNVNHYGSFQYTTSFNPYYGRLAGHVYSKEDQEGRLDSYDYEFGVWNATNRTFTAYPQAASDHDLRQTIFHGISRPTGPVYDQLSYGPSGAAIDPVILEPSRATKEIRVIQGGNLAAKELYVYQGNLTGFALIDRILYERDCLGHATNVFRVDPATGQSRVIYQADFKGTNAWPADLKLSEIDQAGTTVTYVYDCLKRVKSSTKQPAAGQAAVVTAFSYDAAGRVLTNKVTAGTLLQKSISLFDLAGRPVQQIAPQGLTTSFSYQAGGQQTTIVEPSGATTMVKKYLDRRLASITGSAVTNQFFDYSLTDRQVYNCIAAKNVTTVNLGSTNSSRWTATMTDTRYESAGDQRPAFHSTNSLWQEYGFGIGAEVVDVWNTAIDLSDLPSDPYDPSRGYDLYTRYSYDSYGQRISMGTAPPENVNQSIPYDFANNARITTYTNFYQQDAQGAWFHVSEQWSYPYSNSAAPVLASRKKDRLTGFSSAGVSEAQTFDSDTNQTTVTVSIDLPNKRTTTITTVAQSSLSATQTVVNGLLQTESTATVAQPSTHYYDSLGRETGVRDPLGNLTQTEYDPVTGQVTATISARGLRTVLQYYPAGGHAAGLLKCQTGPTGRKTCYDYNDRGQITYVWGDVPYPEKREYDDFGDQVTLTTYRGGYQWSGLTWPADTGPTADVTHWYFDEPTGLLTNKTDAAGQHVTYGYYNTHLPRTRVWARGVGSTNIYRANGDFVRIDYSDGSSVRFTDDQHPYLNRLVKPDVLLDNAGTGLMIYDHAGRVAATTYTAGLLAGITVTNHLDPVYGRDLLQVQLSNAQPAAIYPAAYGHDSYGRLGSVSSGVYSATYDYAPNSDLLQTTTCKNNGATVLTSTRTWDYGYQLRSIANTAAGATVTSHSYLYDWLDRRIQATLEDGSVWKYSYNDRNELVGAHRFWSDWSPVAGQQYGYDYDNIGNRKTAASGGDTGGLNLRFDTYTVNNLNQYTTITNGGFEDILGAALATNGVTVNSGAADRRAEYFHREIAIDNSGGPLWQNVSVSSGGGVTNGGFVFPAQNQALVYDLDGNLSFDGIWTYDWDPENRLVAMSMTNVAGIANSNRLRLDFVYDYHGRRVSKAVSAWSGSAYTNASTTRFVYDGWNLLATLTSDLRPVSFFLWGQDLSGTMDEAGGIGGLLALLETSNGQITNAHFASYDGNGNVMALTRASDFSTSARYEYSPYGETLRATGLIAAANPFRFSTKLSELETRLTYYGLRYYSPDQGRWLSRDPIDESDGVNLYNALRNDPLSKYDADGRFIDMLIAIAADESEEAEAAVRAAGVMKKVKDLARGLKSIQSFMDGYMQAETLFESGALADMAAAVDNLKKNLRLSGHRHHVVPQQSKYLLSAIKHFDIDRLTVFLSAQLHLSGLHGNGYNPILGKFIKDNIERIRKNPMFLIGFGVGMLDKVGLGEAYLNPAAYF